MKRGFEPEMEFLKFFCNKDSNAIDIGANYGIYSLKLSSLANYVYSFEPVPFLYANLLNAFKDIKNIKFYNYGLSNVNSMTTLYSPAYAHAWSTLEKNNPELQRLSNHEKLTEYNIETRKLDYFELKNISFIKIDVEGHEYNVIEGAFNTIKANKSVLQIEIEERHLTGSVHKVIDLVKQISDYSSYYLLNGKLVNFNNFDLSIYQNPNSKIYYIYNFIFIHNESMLLDDLRRKSFFID